MAFNMTTRPTADELKNLEPGRIAWVRVAIREGSPYGDRFRIEYSSPVWLNTEDIVHLEPAQLKVGDRVVDGTADDPRESGEIVHIIDDLAWVVWTGGWRNTIRQLSSLKVAR